MDFSRAQVADFAAFSNALVRSGDIDPQFWVLKEYYRKHKLSKNDALWASLIYLTFYHWGSALNTLEEFPKPQRIKKKDWTTGRIFTKQRRLFRGTNNYFALMHLNAAFEKTDGDLVQWMKRKISPATTPTAAWTLAREAFAELPYVGPWSSYKWCDIIKFIHDYPITAPDIGTKPGDNAGPIAGLASITGLTWSECARNTDVLPVKLHDFLVKEFGVPFNGLDQLESCLCDWQSVLNGRYYIGHDIDRDQEQIEGSKAKAEILKLRSDLFDRRFLGEVQVWPRWIGIRRHLNVAYRHSRKLVNNFQNIKEIKL